MTASCDDYLDITPEGQVKRDDLLSSQDGYEDALYGVYAQMRQTTLYGEYLSFYLLEIMSQTLDCYGSTSVTALSTYDYDYSTIEDAFEGVWTDMYSNISNANSILTSEAMAEADDYPYNIYKGEAIGMRGFMHFDLMRIFCEQYTLNPSADGIPYQTDFSLETPDFESLEDNYAHVIADLREAERLLSNEEQYEDTSTFMTDRQIHFNLHAARATLARVYLTKGDLDSACYYARKVIDESPYRLKEKTEVNNDLAGVLSSKETIFGIYYADWYDIVDALLIKTTSYYSLDPRDDILDMYEEDVNGLDYRSNAYFTTISSGGSEKVRLSKLADVYEMNDMVSYRPDSLILGINLIRLPEMYYICAEALLETDYEEAVDYYNEVINHRGLEDIEETLTVDMITDERYKEYVGEGQSFFNMKRLNLPITSSDGTKTYEASNEIYVVPIPESETENRY